MRLERPTGAMLLSLAAILCLAACQRAPETPSSAASAPPAAEPAAVEPAPQAAEATPATSGLEALPPGVLHAYVWECEDGTTLNVRNLVREGAVTIGLHEGERKLPQVVSASGAKYADETVTFWTKGGEATFERKGSPAVKCQEIRARSLLADARVRGIAYRGTGNEPGWLVEIGPASRLLFVTSYGEERHEFAAASSTGTDPGGTTRFAARQGDEEITVTVSREACVDDMSGAEFDHRMLVEFGGQALRGCATAVQ